MKKRISLLIGIIIFFVLSPTVYALNTNFEIDAYHIQMIVNDDNSYQITEYIDVKYNIPRHGIIRKIPYTTYNGKKAEITDIGVVQHMYTTNKANGYMNIKIGDADKYVEGNQKYIIQYVYTKGYDYIDDMDELYFNLIGTEWDVYIRNVTFDITMPSEFDAASLNFTYGQEGSTNNEQISYVVEGNKIKGQLNKELGPKEAVTVALPLPEGYYINAEKETFSVDIKDVFSKQYMMLYAIAALISGLLYYLLGRNKRIYPPVQFYPPNGLTPADVGYIFDGQPDPQDITALIIYWAHKGLLQIQEYPHPKKRKKTQIFLQKLNNMGPDAKPYEQTMFTSLFNTYGDGQIVNLDEIKRTFYPAIVQVQNALRRTWHDNKETRIYSQANEWLKILVMIPSIIIIALTFMREQSGINFSDIGTFGFAIILSIIWHIPVRMFTYALVNRKKILKSIRFKTMIKRFFWFIVALAAIGAYAYYSTDISMAIGAVVISFLICLLVEKIHKTTEVGNAYLESIMGFRDFILYAEKDKIEMLVNENPAYFFHVLPYAVAFKITDKWAKKFEGIALPQPSWYQNSQTNNDYYYDSFMYASTLVDMNNDVASTMKYDKPARSSSSGGSGGSSDGGFSGGGDGGGGGDDW